MIGEYLVARHLLIWNLNETTEKVKGTYINNCATTVTLTS
jgi:hypothetical protein